MLDFIKIRIGDINKNDDAEIIELENTENTENTENEKKETSKIIYDLGLFLFGCVIGLILLAG